MAFCKVCACGEKIVFEQILSFPENCPSCGRKLIDFIIRNEDDPCVDEVMSCNAVAEVSENEEKAVSIGCDFPKKRYILKLNDSKEIEIPNEGGIVGRTEIGASELSEFPSVSRQHLRVTIRRSVGALVEDISTYGTLVDGQRIIKNFPTRVSDGSVVTLCDVDAVLIVKGVND